MRFVIAGFVIIVTFVILAGSYAKTEPLSLEEQNMDIVRLSVLSFNAGDWPSFAELHSPNWLQHTPNREDPVTWLDYELACRIAHRRVPELQYRIVDIFAVKDKVAVRSVWECRIDSYEFKRYFPDGVGQGSEISIFRIKDGKIIEEWCEYDDKNINCVIHSSKRREHMK